MLLVFASTHQKYGPGYPTDYILLIYSGKLYYTGIAFIERLDIDLPLGYHIVNTTIRETFQIIYLYTGMSNN
jgi:hypothetical protein